MTTLPRPRGSARSGRRPRPPRRSPGCPAARWSPARSRSSCKRMALTRPPKRCSRKPTKWNGRSRAQSRPPLHLPRRKGALTDARRLSAPPRSRYRHPLRHRPPRTSADASADALCRHGRIQARRPSDVGLHRGPHRVGIRFAADRPVLVNSLEATKTGDESKNHKTMPHVVVPPITWTPVPRPLKLKVSPPPPDADSPAAPPRRFDLHHGVEDRSVPAEQRVSAAGFCHELRRPCPVAELHPSGRSAGASCGGGRTARARLQGCGEAFFLRNKWTAGLLREFAFLASGRLRSILSWAACTLTGHRWTWGRGGS